MGDVNFNIFNFNSIGSQPDLLNGINSTALQGANDILSDIFSSLGNLFDTLGNQFSNNNQNIQPGGCVSSPSPSDCSHPQGSLTTDGDTITTPGGYKIQALSQYEWKITGPDGKSTRVWGDPHVDEGDGGKWDFKRDSTFVLGDGTKINVSTTPYGNGATVTSGLEVISGNDRVSVSGIDKGKGVVGQVTQDGYSHANDFGGNDVFVMGKESDDWSYQGKEITGSDNQGETFKLGNDLPAGNTNPASNSDNAVDWMGFINMLTGDMSNNWNSNWRPNNVGSNPYYNGLSNNQTTGNDNQTTGSSYDRSQHLRQMGRAFHLLGRMFNTLAQLSNLSDRMNASRSRALYA